MPKVSVIIPNYNHAHFLRQRIESVLQQTYQDFEVILMDDCSTDESRTIISQYAKHPNVRVEFNDRNSGSTFKQWKKGVQLARGQYIWIAESDDYSNERFLERLVPLLEQEPDVTFVYCRSWMIRENGERNGFADRYLAEIDPQRWTADFRADGLQSCRDHFVHSNSVPNASAVVFRKNVYEQVGGVDETLLVCGDWKLWVLLALEGKIAYIGEPLNYYREHLENVRTRIYQTGRGAGEHLGMVRWMLGRVTPTKNILEKAYFVAAFSWIPAVLSRRVPWRQRWALLRDAIRTDPHAIRRLIRPVLIAARMKVALELRLLRQRFESRVS